MEVEHNFDLLRFFLIAIDVDPSILELLPAADIDDWCFTTVNINDLILLSPNDGNPMIPIVNTEERRVASAQREE